jgi:hypothetical protein
MTYAIRRTVTVTIIETITLIWIHTSHDDDAPANDARDAVLAQSTLETCSAVRVTSSVNTTVWPTPPTMSQEPCRRDQVGFIEEKQR